VLDPVVEEQALPAPNNPGTTDARHVAKRARAQGETGSATRSRRMACRRDKRVVRRGGGAAGRRGGRKSAPVSQTRARGLGMARQLPRARAEGDGLDLLHGVVVEEQVCRGHELGGPQRGVHVDERHEDVDRVRR